MKNTKGQMTINAISAVAIVFVVAAVIMSIGSLILNDVGNEIGDSDVNHYQCGTNGSYAFNSSCNGAEGIDKISSWLPTIGLIVAAAIIIGIVVSSLGGRRQ